MLADDLSQWLNVGRQRAALADAAATRGETWEQLREGLPQAHAYDVVYRHALANAGPRLAFGSTTGNLYVSEDRGERWEAVAHNLPPIYSVRFG